MPRVYELPTHLQVEDTLIAGLTARRLLRLIVGASLAYGLWDQTPWLPDQVRWPVAASIALIGVAAGLLEWNGRSVDRWLLSALLFAVAPRRLVWRPGAALQPRRAADVGGWAELDVRPAWAGRDADPDVVHEERARFRRAWWHSFP